MKDKVMKAYAKLAKDYETNVDVTSSANAFYERPAVMQLMPESMHELVVLDAGCAAGWYTEQFLEMGANVTAIDFSPEMAEACKRRVGDRANIFVHDLSDPLPVPDSTFDLILSSLTLHYIDSWDFTFQEFRRVLKPGGRLIFSVHHPFMDFVEFDRPDYFAHELLSDVWRKKEAGEVEVTFYRRPLQEIVNVTTRYFALLRLVEPRPAPGTENQWESQNWYHRLMTHPHFLIVEARK